MEELVLLAEGHSTLYFPEKKKYYTGEIIMSQKKNDQLQNVK